MEGGESSLFLNRRLLIGPFLTALILLLLEISSRLFGMTVPNPAVIYLTAVVYAVFEGGIVPGAISACMTLFYAASFFSLPGRLFHYSDENAARMIVLMVATPAIT